MKLKIFYLAFLSGSLFINAPAAAQVQSPEMTRKFFPAPSAEFSTPTLLIPGDKFAAYDQIMDWLQARVEKNKNLTLEYIGTSPGGYKIPILYFKHPDNIKNRETAPPGEKKIKVWMQGAIHGNEPAGAEGLFMLTDYLLENPRGKELLRNVDLAILPIANMDGYLAGQRRSAGGYDLNRDQTKFADPVSKIIKRAFIRWNPDVAVDFHEYQPIRKELAGIGPSGASLYYDVLFLPTGYPNVPEQLRKASVDIFQQAAEQALDAIGYTHHFYFSVTRSDNEMVLLKGAKSPQSSSTSYALSNAISMLVEIRGINLGRLCLERRTNAAFTVARTFMEQAALQGQQIRDILRSSLQEITSRNCDIYVTGTAKDTVYPVKFIDLRSNELIQLDRHVKDALLIRPDLKRSRPVAYLLEPECIEDTERLALLGLRIDTLKRDTLLEVESYRITAYEEAAALWEKIKKATVSAETVKTHKLFPEGSFLVPLAQENANFAVSLLEPEAENGFVAFRVTGTRAGDTLKVHRLYHSIHY